MNQNMIDQKITQKQLNLMKHQALERMNHKELGRIRVMERLLGN